MKNLQSMTALSLWVSLMISHISHTQEVKDASSEKISLPVRVFRLQSDVSKKIHCTMTDKQLKECFTIVNENWASAHIHWILESVHDVKVDSKIAESYEQSLTNNARRADVRTLSKSFPVKSMLKDGFNVFIVESMGKGAGGVFRPRPHGDIIYAHQSPRGFAVPAILAHELGHALSLPHTVFETNNNLMMGAGPGRKPTRVKPLTDSQIYLARAQAKLGHPFRPSKYKNPVAEDELFSFLDTNKDDRMTVEEVAVEYRGFVENTLRLASRAPHDSLTKDEYDLLKIRLSKQRQPRKGQRVGPSVDALFARSDKNQDGKMSRDESKGNISMRNFNMSDRDKDGFITKEDVIETRKRFGITAEGFRVNHSK